MLEDQTFQHIVCWGPHGDCFVVKDMNEFTKTVLPRMFKHQNFASFVRQLNKYDFHKVKNTDDNAYGEQVCFSTFHSESKSNHRSHGHSAIQTSMQTDLKLSTISNARCRRRARHLHPSLPLLRVPWPRLAETQTTYRDKSNA